jgi:Helix-turn-helix domain
MARVTILRQGVKTLKTSRIPNFLSASRQDQPKALVRTDIVMSYADTARFLRISERTLERYVRESRIPYVAYPRRGGTRTVVRFLRPQLLKWLEQRTVRPSRHNGAVAEGGI